MMPRIDLFFNAIYSYINNIKHIMATYLHSTALIFAFTVRFIVQLANFIAMT